MTPKHYIIHTDGGARGNPGPSAIGVVIEENHRVVKEISKTIGSATNNQAEYQAVYAALAWAVENKAETVDLFSDSELVVCQLRGEYKVKNKDLGEWFIRIKSLMHRMTSVKFHAIPREKNTLADNLVNQALDHE